jgi:hypothetical protein
MWYLSYVVEPSERNVSEGKEAVYGCMYIPTSICL